MQRLGISHHAAQHGKEASQQTSASLCTEGKLEETILFKFWGEIIDPQEPQTPTGSSLSLEADVENLVNLVLSQRILHHGTHAEVGAPNPKRSSAGGIDQGH
ncbi:hypothetical protein RRG08_036111 [Elysia crispata]|uniref:Uncharacterized protein n=1 Tax=Elysia crispata TaxID=231223 RepID=A0AAE1ALE5_9GAST|nr:hypothetical protein RRG08_036111 [Elysia crispata]